MAEWREYLGDKDFYKKIIAIALPISAQQLITVGVNLMDTVMLSFMGDASILRPNASRWRCGIWRKPTYPFRMWPFCAALTTIPTSFVFLSVSPKKRPFHTERTQRTKRDAARHRPIFRAGFFAHKVIFV